MQPMTETTQAKARRVCGDSHARTGFHGRHTRCAPRRDRPVRGLGGRAVVVARLGLALVGRSLDVGIGDGGGLDAAQGHAHPIHHLH